MLGSQKTKPGLFLKGRAFLVGIHFMPYYVYILRNEESGALYTGHTSDLAKRLARHNDKSLITKRYTKKYEGNWVHIYSEEYATRSEAMLREKFLKTGAGRLWIGKNIDIGR